MSYSDLMQLEYLDAVVKEILRLHTSVIVGRTTLKQVTLQRHTTNNTDKKEKDVINLPANSNVMMIPQLIHQNKHVYAKNDNDCYLKSDPTEFDPDRFLEPKKASNSRNNMTDKNSNNNNNMYMPFSVGPRFCVGQPLAVLQIKTVVAHVVHEYVLQPHYHDDTSSSSIDPIAICNVTIRPHSVLLKLRCRH